jgi:hypothetical protein
MPRKLNRQEKERRKYERAVFIGFLKTRPLFAGSPIRYWIWNRKDPPDIYCWTEDGRKIGIELVSWIDQKEMAAAKRTEKAEENLRKRIGLVSSINCRNVRFAVIHPLPTSSRPKSRTNLRTAFNRILKRVDSNWPELEERNKVRLAATDLPAELAEAVSHIEFFGRTEGGPPQNINVITPARGGPYTTETMLKALHKNVQKKCSHYTRRQFPAGGAHLLIHYDQAWMYCSPIIDPFTKPQSYAKQAAAWLNDAPGPFDQAFLYIGLEPGRESFDLM